MQDVVTVPQQRNQREAFPGNSLASTHIAKANSRPEYIHQ